LPLLRRHYGGRSAALAPGGRIVRQLEERRRELMAK
jgi:hypothetical protein